MFALRNYSCLCRDSSQIIDTCILRPTTFTVLQYGRQNIENVRKRNGTRDRNKDFNIEEECESPTITEKDSMITSPKMQNGNVSNSVIARSKDFILVPEPEMHNHKNYVDESNLKNNHEQPMIDAKKVNLEKNM